MKPTDRPTLLGSSKAMREALATLGRAARSSATVLLRGETGTGKELAARMLHEASPRAAGPFVKIDCTSLPENLLESELFGYERGAFTGATARKPGRVELAHGGTLFLDEIGELTPPLQAKLLRLLQDRTLERLGGTSPIHVDARVVAATHRDLESMVERRELRQDLFFRLDVVTVWLPPLRARRDDITLLARHFAARVGSDLGRDVTLDEGALKALRARRWPGNVRQLEHAIERLVVLHDSSSITREDVELDGAVVTRFETQPSTGASGGAIPSAPERVPLGPLDRELHALERRMLVRALEHVGGNRVAAAQLLGIARSTLYEKLNEHGLAGG